MKFIQQLIEMLMDGRWLKREIINLFATFEFNLKWRYQCQRIILKKNFRVNFRLQIEGGSFIVDFEGEFKIVRIILMKCGIAQGTNKLYRRNRITNNTFFLQNLIRNFNYNKMFQNTWKILNRFNCWEKKKLFANFAHI